MKKYILMTMGITGMGGGQMYIRNKLLYKKNQGWDVFAFGCLKGDIIIPELIPFKNDNYNELTSVPFVYSNEFVIQTVKKIIDRCNIKENDEVVIETGTPHMSYWGEIVAYFCNGKHFCFLLDERNDILVNKNYLPFFSYKLHRHELAGISKNSIPNLFRGTEDSCKKDGPMLSALCQNVVADIELKDNFSIPKADITIASIGRLEKPYVLKMVDEVTNYVNLHKEKCYNLVLIGGTNNNSVLDRIEILTSKASNLNLVSTGYLYPIPKKLFGMVDLFVSSAGSAGVSYAQNVTTISIDANDGMPIGILGYTTQKALFRENEPIQSLSSLLYQILDENCLEHMEYTPKKVVSQDILKEHDLFWEQSDAKNEYYPVMSLHPVGKDRIKKMIIRLFGVRFFLSHKK